MESDSWSGVVSSHVEWQCFDCVMLGLLTDGICARLRNTYVVDYTWTSKNDLLSCLIVGTVAKATVLSKDR